MTTTLESLQNIIEAAIMVAGRPLTKVDLQKLFDESSQPSATEIQTAIAALQEKYHQTSGIELREVASGFQFQAKAEFSPWLTRLWEERPARYSRAFLETLALIAYRQPITRAEIEDIRGVAVSTNIVKTLLEREWIRVIGYKDVPGKPALYGTTKSFLDDFNLKALDQLPTLAEIKNLDEQEKMLNVQLELATDTTKPDNLVNLDTSEVETNNSKQTNENSKNPEDIDKTEPTISEYKKNMEIKEIAE